MSCLGKKLVQLKFPTSQNFKYAPNIMPMEKTDFGPVSQ
jgi:hypothetical protein